MNQRQLELRRRVHSEPVYRADARQEEVIAYRGRLGVLGAPGTGKSSTLIRSVLARVAKGTDPDSILILTYGRQSAAYLRDEIARGAESTSFEPLARTFHSLAFSILNHSLRPEDPTYVLISGAEQDAYIKDLLANPLVPIEWHPELAKARTTQGFVREVRDLISRATELNLTAKELQSFGIELNEKYWDGAAKFWASYYGSMQLRNHSVADTAIRIDPSAIIVEAISRLQTDPALLTYYRQTFTTIVVDEFQESDKSQRELLTLLAGDDLLVFADPDSSIGRFRGADPENLLRYLEDATSSQVILNQDHRSTTSLSELRHQISQGFRSRNPARLAERVNPSKAVEGSKSVDIAKFANQSEAANHIAYHFRKAHLDHRLPWSEMAVVLRSPGSQVSAIQRAFAQNGIPLNIDAQALALADNPALRPILDIAQCVLKPSLMDTAHWPKIEELLLSEFGGADAIQIRQIRLALSKGRSEGDLRSTTQMMIDLMTSPVAGVADVGTVLESQVIPLLRIRSLLAAGAKKKSDIEELLWAIWSTATDYQGTSLSKKWRELALAGGNRGSAADRDLDSVIQLFEAARRFTERTQSASPQLFIDQILEERILSDAISFSAQRENVVTLTTVHSAKGLEWELVAIPGLQEGQWPNLTERGSLLGSERLVESIRTGLKSKEEVAAATASALLEDERRLLYVALSRAKSRLIITACHEEDSHPSRYFEELYEALHGGASDELDFAVAERSLTPQALVASLRRDLIADDQEKSAFAAGLLKQLAGSGIRSADPSQWLGVRPLSTQMELIPAGDEVYLSPSSLQSFVDCGLKWFLEKSGAKDGDSTAQLLGVAIHALAALVLERPQLSAADAIESLTNAWGIVDQNVGWYKDAQLKSASAMVERFFAWDSKNDRVLLAVEKNFLIKVGRAVIKGQVDRLESNPEGTELHIVDLKTGKTPATKVETDEHRQLKAYQLAILRDGFVIEDEPRVTEIKQSGGAELLFLAKTTDSIKAQAQLPIIQSEVEADILQIADGMAAATFTARANKRCTSCALRSICPLQPEGRSVIE